MCYSNMEEEMLNAARKVHQLKNQGYELEFYKVDPKGDLKAISYSSAVEIGSKPLDSIFMVQVQVLVKGMPESCFIRDFLKTEHETRKVSVSA